MWARGAPQVRCSCAVAYERARDVAVLNRQRRHVTRTPVSQCRAAISIVSVTAPGFEIIGRWDVRTWTMCASARSAIASCRSGGITLSMVPTSYHEGIVFHAGNDEGSLSAPRVIGRCVAASTAPVDGGRSLAEAPAN